MKLIITETRAVITPNELRAAYPEVSFPPDSDMNNEMLIDYGATVLEYDERPEVPEGGSLLAGVVRIEDGRTIQSWVVEAPTVEMRKAVLTQLNNAQYSASIDQLTFDYPAAEIATWERQRAEAVAWGVNSAAATPWIDLAATARGLDRDEYLARTLAKVIAFAGATAYLTGRRQGIDDQLRAATTAEELAAVVIDYTMPGA